MRSSFMFSGNAIRKMSSSQTDLLESGLQVETEPPVKSEND